MEMVKVYAVYKNGIVPEEIIQIFKLDSLLKYKPLKPTVVKVRVRWNGQEKLLPLLTPKMVDLMALSIKPEIEVVVGEME